MQVHFVLTTGKPFTLICEPSDTFTKISRKITSGRHATGKFQLVYDGHELDKNSSLVDIKYQENTFIIILLISKPIKRVQVQPPALNSPVNGFEFFDIDEEEEEEEEFFEDPQNIDEMVANLSEMGFDAAQCLTALRSTQYNVNDSLNMLLSGNVPVQTNKVNQESSDTDTDHADKHFLTPDEVFSTFSEQQKEDIKQLIDSTGHDQQSAVFIYDECKRNKETTLLMMQNFK